MKRRSAVFLDRDGTLIEEKNYLSDPNQVTLLDGVVDGLKALQELNLPLVIVTNQSGIGRGLFSLQDAEAVNARIEDELAARGINIAAWYMCPHTPADGCHCRKPMPGLIEMACNDLGLDPQRSFVVGDKRSDIDLARAVGAEAFLVTTGYGADAAQYARELGIPVCESLLEVSASILARLYQSSRTSEL
jgi:histidinol-phosphate phosphatase family protein